MKTFQSVVALSLIFAVGAGLAIAREPQPKPAVQPEKMNHDQMKMDHGQMKKGHDSMPMDHSKMADAEFTRLDKNKDGKVSKDEIPADSPMLKHFSMLDTDKDGSLSQAEFTKHHGM